MLFLTTSSQAELGALLVSTASWASQHLLPYNRIYLSAESDMTERLPFHFSLPCIGEGNGNPLQCSCLENPRDGGAWWEAVYGVAQSRTRLKQLSSSSSPPFYPQCTKD